MSVEKRFAANMRYTYSSAIDVSHGSPVAFSAMHDALKNVPINSSRTKEEVKRTSCLTKQMPVAWSSVDSSNVDRLATSFEATWLGATSLENEFARAKSSPPRNTPKINIPQPTMSMDHLIRLARRGPKKEGGASPL